MTPAQALRVLFARWRLAALVFLTVLGIVSAATFLRPPQYTATASLVLDVKSPDPIAGIVLPGMTAVSYMATQLDVMHSERVALRALQTLGSEKDPVLRQQWLDETGGAGDFRAWLAEAMLKRLETMPMRDSNVVTLAYTSDDPASAAAAANALLAAYIDTTVDLRVEPAKRYNSFFDGRAKQLRDDLEQAQKRLSGYQQEKGIVASDERLDVENLRLSELSSQLVALQAITNESGGRQSLSAANAERMQEVLNSPILVSLNAELARVEGRLNEVTARLGDSHPQVIELRATIRPLRERIASETRRVTGSLAVNNSVNQGRLAQLRTSVEEQRSKLLKLKGLRDESAVLLRDVENAQRAYDAGMARAGQSSAESQATQTNVSILKNATPPSQPSSPRVRLNLLIAAFIGSLLAVCAVLLRELTDRRLRAPSDVVLGLQQPLLGVMPSTTRSKSVRGARLLTVGRTLPALMRSTE